MAHALVSDVANVIRIDTFRSTPLVVELVELLAGERCGVAGVDAELCSDGLP